MNWTCKNARHPIYTPTTREIFKVSLPRFLYVYMPILDGSEHCHDIPHDMGWTKAKSRSTNSRHVHGELSLSQNTGKFWMFKGKFSECETFQFIRVNMGQL